MQMLRELKNYKLFYTSIKTSKLFLWHFIVLLAFIKMLFFLFSGWCLRAPRQCFSFFQLKFMEGKFSYFSRNFYVLSCEDGIIKMCFQLHNFQLEKVFIDFSGWSRIYSISDFVCIDFRWNHKGININWNAPQSFRFLLAT